VKSITVVAAFLACFVCNANAADGPSSRIFREDFTGPLKGGVPQGWDFWSPSRQMQLSTSSRRGGFTMSGAGNSQAKGRLWRAISGFRAGEWYRFTVRTRVERIADPRNTVLAVIELAGSQNWHVLMPESAGPQEMRLGFTLQFPNLPTPELKLHLFAGFIPDGSVEWRDVSIERLDGYVRPKRPVRLAVVDSKPAKPGSPEAGAAHYAAEIDRACRGAKTDLVLLPENFNKSNVTPADPWSLDSPLMATIRAAARRNRVYVAGSLFQDDHGIAFNTGFLIDREGRIAGTYRKSHLTVGEMLFATIGRGDELPVFNADFGKIGLAVCYDFHFPEVARLLALRGAELVLVPMAADDRLREDGTAASAEHSGKAFVLENRIPVAFAATLGRTVQPSLIIDQHAKVRARSSDEEHIIAADLDLADPALRWSGDEWRYKYTVGRRPELYRALGLGSLN
jgi:predicted amidohydrolase